MSNKFVIVGAARTGSTLLVRTLNTVEGVCCHGELLADKVRGLQDGFDPLKATQQERDERAQRLLQQREQNPRDFIYSALDTGDTVTGFKALYSDLLDPRWQAVNKSLLDMPGIRFIHLVRRNSLRRFISQKILQSGGPNHSAAGGNSDKKIKVHIDIGEYLESTAQVEEEGRGFLALLGDRPVLEVSYEQLASDTAGTVADVCRFLGVASVPTGIEPALQKVGAADLRESVSNFDELLDNPATRELALAN